MNKVNIAAITSAEQLTGLKPWLETFDHGLPPNLVGKFHAFTKGERLLAITQQTQLTALFPAVNPKVCSPRETYEIVRAFHTWHAVMPGGLAVSVPTTSHMHKFMEKLGYRPLSVLYEPIP